MATLEAAWRGRGRKLKRDYERLLQVEWQIGEWWLSASDAWRKRAEHDPDLPSVHVCRAAATCCKKFPIARRRTSVPLAHHREVASLPAKVADVLLKEDEAKHFTIEQLRRKKRDWKVTQNVARQKGGTVADLHDLVRQGRRFATLYVDVPWPWKNEVTNGAAANHYPTMPLADIYALPIPDLAMPNAHLHLWVPMAFVPEAIEALRVWGFRYCGGVVWHKLYEPPTRLGIGPYWRVETELLLLGIRGSLPFADHTLRNFIEAPVGEHSEKPAEFRALIEKASPPPRIELFARKRTPGWQVWGNEVS